MGMSLPRHIAIIMDGNGRWAQQRQLPRIAGHQAAIEAVRQSVEYCVTHKIEVLSLFAFSSENWQRPESEVNFLMELFLTTIQSEITQLHANNIQLRFIGDLTALNQKLQNLIQETESQTKKNTGLKLVIAANYGGRWDLLQAVNRLVEDKQNASLRSIKAEDITQRLTTSDLPEPDLFIRTSGEKRISNFFLWQLVYTELYFTDIYWPDFDQTALKMAIEDYSKRQRRYGSIK